MKAEKAGRLRVSPSLDTLAVFERVAARLNPTQPSKLGDGAEPEERRGFKTERELAESIEGWSVQRVYGCLNDMARRYGTLTDVDQETNRLVLTPKGKEVQAWAGHVLEAHRRGPLRAEERLRFVLGTTNRSLVFVLPKAVAAYFDERNRRRAREPALGEVDVRFIEYNSVTDMVNGLRYGEVDAGVGALPHGYKETEGISAKVFLGGVRTKLIIPTAFEKKFPAKSVTPGQIAGETICVIEADRCGILKSVLERIASRSVVVTTNYSSVVALCSAGVGLGFIPVLKGENDLQGIVLTRTIKGVDFPAREVAFWKRQPDTLARAGVAEEVEAFKTALEAAYRSKRA